MGIAMMRERVEAIGGLLSINSEVGPGIQVQVVWNDPSAQGELA